MLYYTAKGFVMKNYFKYKIQNLLQIKNIITIEYLELFPNYGYKNETHDFWEIVYVDNGKIECKMDTCKLEISQGELYLIKPGTNHSYHVSGKNAPSIFVVCFESDTKLLQFISGKMPLHQKNIELISDIMNETKGTFKLPFKKKLRLIEKPNPGGQQLIRIYLEQLLILLLRESLNIADNVKFFMTNVELENHVVNEIVAILKSNLYSDIDIDFVCKKLNYSKTYLNNMCKKHINYTIMHYYTLLKINEAKKLIRENKYNITEISGKLNFDNSNYFTKVFKNYTNMTPSQYKKSIMADS